MTKLTNNYYYKLVYAHNIPNQYPWSGTDLDLKDGFIHLADNNNINQIYNKFFSPEVNKTNKTVYIMAIKPCDIKNKLKIEANKPSGNKYPHYYGALSKNSIEWIKIFEPE